MQPLVKKVALRIKGYGKFLYYLAFGRSALRKVAQYSKSEDGATLLEISIKEAEAFISWEEPNRANTPTLYICGSGERYSTLTGVWWLDERYFIVSHRSGLSIAIFDRCDPEVALCKVEVSHTADDIAAKRVTENEWEISLSGCWECIYSRYKVVRTDSEKTKFEIELLDTLQHRAKDFCHGVAYDDSGQICYTIHTGKNPRLSIGDRVSQLPAPWGARDICYDPKSERYISIAVSVNPQNFSYSAVKSSLWVCGKSSQQWECLAVYDNLHSDAVDVWGDCIWIPDQLGNRLLCIDDHTGAIKGIVVGDSLNLPHGLGISVEGTIAVTNYGTSSVTLLDGSSLLKSLC